MPDPQLPEGETPNSFLRKHATEKLAQRVKNADERAFERLSFELDVIEKTGFASYFLLVGEFAQFTRDKGIAYGVRGSAAGSLVSYCIGITDVDPLEYDLTFERFLNPERVSMPDIDMDFEDARRDEVIQYVNERFGKDHVAQIVTFGTLGAKAAIKDCGRVQGYSPQETDRICKTIPNMPGMSIDRAIAESGEFRRMIDSDPRVETLVKDAKKVEGIARHSGVHAAGIVISREPLMDLIPLYRGTDGQPVTACVDSVRRQRDFRNARARGNGRRVSTGIEWNDALRRRAKTRKHRGASGYGCVIPARPDGAHSAIHRHEARAQEIGIPLR
jgi:DNA polymerase-3 subunit alpha